MQKPMVFIAGMVAGAAAVVILSAWWTPAQQDEVQMGQPEPAVRPANSDPTASAKTEGPDMQRLTPVQLSTAQTSSAPNKTTVVCPEPVEFSPAQLDELAEQRRERQERVDRSNMHLRYPAAYAGKYAAFQGNEFYASAVESFETAELTSDWAEKAQQVIQQFFDQRPDEFANIRLECRAAMCRIEGQAISLEAYDRYFDDPRKNIWPTLGMSAWGGRQYMVPNDSSNVFVYFKYKNDDDFKKK